MENSCTTGNEQEKLTLLTLPPEILLHICSFLDAKFVITILSGVCRDLHDLVNDTATWKIRIAKRFPKPYPLLPKSDEEFDWQAACIEREEKYHLWHDPRQTMDHFVYKEEIFAPVDGVHLIKDGTLLAAGSRDRYLNIVDITKLNADDPTSTTDAKVLSVMDAHQGWIWTLASVNNSLCTGSWDTKIKFWDLDAHGRNIHTVKLKSAVLCMHYEENELWAGCYDKKTYQIDPRTGKIVNEWRHHTKPVLSMAADDNFIITGSEDKTICIYDRRMKSLKTVDIGSFAMSVSYGGGQLWVGDKAGHIHLLDPTDGMFTIVQTFETGHSGKITGIHHSMGAIFTSSTDKTVRILEPNQDPGIISKLTFDQDAAALSYQNNTLAVACSDASISIWRPKPGAITTEFLAQAS